MIHIFARTTHVTLLH